MKKYEFFCVLAQELHDEQVSATVAMVQQVLRDLGAEHIEERVIGKQRLAYPFPNRQAYGTFVLVVFEIEPEAIEEFKQKIRFESGIVRSVVRLFSGEATVKPATVRGSERSAGDAPAPTREHSEVVEPEVEVRRASGDDQAAQPVADASVDVDKPSMSQEELDKRIDALLNEDIDPEKF